MNKLSLSNIFKSIGPGLLFAGAAIGVSHLVQSTRAGAMYGFALLGFIILVNILKFPFFEFGPRYTAATGESLLHGYKKLGSWAVIAFLFFTIATMFIIQAALLLVTASLSTQVFGESWTVLQYGIGISVLCAVILIVGKYSWLDRVMKVMIVLLSISTIFAVGVAALNYVAPVNVIAPVILSTSSIAFLVALTGWMPAPIEISVWHSAWSIQRAKQTGHHANLKEAGLDFHIGYWGTMVMAILFLCLGAMVMFPRGEVFPDSSIAFAKQVISLYADTLGSWSLPVISLMTMVTMFSTSLACFDAFPRALNEALIVLNPSIKEKERVWYRITLIVLAVGALFILGKYTHRIKSLIDLATTMSFLAAPVMAFLNYRAVTLHCPDEAKPKGLIKWISKAGLVFLTLFAVGYLYWKINM